MIVSSGRDDGASVPSKAEHLADQRRADSTALGARRDDEPGDVEFVAIVVPGDRSK
jgi:hypothetical protein